MDKQVRELHAVLVVSYRGTWIETNIGRELIHVHKRRILYGGDAYKGAGAFFTMQFQSTHP